MIKKILLFFILLIPNLAFSYIPSELKSFDWHNCNERIHYKSGMLFMKKALWHAQQMKASDAMKYDCCYILEIYISKISYDNRNNNAIAKACWWDLVRCVNKHDEIPDNWIDIDFCLKRAQENFQIDDTR